MTQIEIKDLHVNYKSKKNVFGGEKTVFAVNGVSLEIKKGEIFSIAGESGCGKSTLAKALMKLVDTTSGEINLNGKNILTNFDMKTKKEFYQKVQLVFQNPYSSLNPKMKIGEILIEPLDINRKNLTKEEKRAIIKEKLEQVGLDESCLKLYPHEFSGGQRQRIAIAKALVLEPEIIIADEPVSALDVSIQAQIINLIKDLQQNLGLTFLFISHDLSVIKYISDRVAVMYLGEIVEQGLTEEIFNNPKHPYTKALLSAVPSLDMNNKENVVLKGELPNPENLPTGCKFHTRCPYVMDKCTIQVPENIKISQTQSCKCFLCE